MRKTRFLTSLAAKALVVAAVAGGSLLTGGVANAQTPGGSEDTGTIGVGGAGGLDLDGLLGPILGSGQGGTSGPARADRTLTDWAPDRS
ncbi:MAG: hypothetical protein M3186_08420 [Actinomycetota bacterium]|nr:hypothetical protein [Actinomycetota bacterium]